MRRLRGGGVGERRRRWTPGVGGMKWSFLGSRLVVSWLERERTAVDCDGVGTRRYSKRGLWLYFFR